jgi:hypothetical protein
MNEAVEERDEDEAPPERKRGAAEMRRLAALEEGKWTPDQYRCRFCPVSVIERDRPGHLSRCAAAPPGVHVDEAFDLRPRSDVPTTVRRGRPKRRAPRPDQVRAPVDPDVPTRAADLVAAMQTMTRPIGMPAISYFARRQKWTSSTLEAAISYCEREHLIEAGRSPGRARIYRLTGEAMEHDQVVEQLDAALPPAAAAPTTTGVRVIELRRPQPKPENTMAKDNDWISRDEAAELLDVDAEKVSYLGLHGHLVRRGKARATEYSRASIIAFKAKAAAGEAPVEPKKPRRATVKRKARPVAQAAKRATASTAAAGELAEDVRALIKCVERGWLTEGDAFAKLRDLVG